MKMLTEEGGSLFDSRSASLGHTLQGGIPSPTDRTRAVRLSLKCMAFVEKHHELLLKHPGHVGAVGARAGHGRACRHEEPAWWEELAELVEALVVRPQIQARCSNLVNVYVIEHICRPCHNALCARTGRSRPDSLSSLHASLALSSTDACDSQTLRGPKAGHSAPPSSHRCLSHH